MSGDVQPRKRKDKKKKKDDLGTEEPRGTAAALGEGDVFMHSYQDHGTGGHWCAKIIFFSLLAVLVTLIGLIILENRGLTELEANSVESRYSGVLEGWIEDAIDDHHDEHTLELKHHDNDEDHPDDQLDENEAEEESLEEDVEHNDDDEINEYGGESDEIEDEDDTQNEDEEDDTQNEEDDDEEDDTDNEDEDEDDERQNYEDEIEKDDDEEGETHDDEDEGQDEDSVEDDGKYDEIEENFKNEDDEEETYEHYSYKDVKSNENDENDDEDERDMEKEKDDYLSKESPSHYNYHESSEDDDDESKETKYDDEYNTEDEEEDDHGDDDDDDDEEEIEKIEKEIIDGDDSEEIVDTRAPASREKRDTSKETVTEDSSKDDEDDEPPIEKISRPQAGKPFVEIEEEVPVKPVDTLAEEEAYERQQEELRRQEEEAPHSQGGGNSLATEWPGEPSDPYWRAQLDTAEEEFRQGRWAAAAARAGGGGLDGSGRARWLRARALDRAADTKRDNRLLADAVAAYLHLLKMNEALSDERLLEVARRTVDRIQFRGTYLRAEPVYRLLIRRFPDEVDYRNNLTILFLMANRADLAEEVLKETLRLWPNDLVALAHHGFVLKTHYNKLEEAIKALQKALDGDAGRANEPRFYYHLGDALLMLGRLDEAHEVHKRGTELGHFLSPSQRSLYNVPRLRAQPWWRVEETPYAKLARALENSWRDILKEGEAAVALYEQEKEGLKERGEWSQLDIFVRGREVGGRCARAPAVCAALRGEGEGCRRGQVKFSLMSPGTHVRPHVGPTNCRLRMHLALSNTEGTYIRVDKETRQWQVGKTLIFDDSFEHEVWHNGTGSRLVLIVDVWHPDLTAAEKRQLPAI